jgi:hypothetical protein
MPRRLDSDKQQLSLFPTDLRHLAESIGLDWWAAKKLYDDKWLSFDPEIITIDNSSKEAEFIFLGTLVAAGCDPRMLKRLLETLEKPYCYGLSGMYYDWAQRCWIDHESPPQDAAKIVSEFEDDGDAASLEELKELAQEAINRLLDGVESPSTEQIGPPVYDGSAVVTDRQVNADIKEKISPRHETTPVDTTVAARISALHERQIPKHLMQEDGQRIGQEFDPNAYFTVLAHLSMKDGYTLDYFYQIDSFAGEPYLYARHSGDEPFKTYREYESWEKTYSLISFIITDGTPDSFFELAVFLRLAGQFYHWRHAGYNDLQIITSAADIERIITDVKGREHGSNFDSLEITTLRSLETQPKVEMTDDSATVTLCGFTNWGGFKLIKERFNRQFPHIILGSEIIDVVKYDCGIRF